MLKPITNMFGFFVFLGLVFQAHSMDLSGEWAFRLDAANEGIENQWFNQKLSDTIRIPGSLQEQGFGNEPSFQTEWVSGIGMELLDDPRFTDYTQAEDFQCPFWLTPERHYVGPAWYQKQVNIPPDWQGQRILLTLERPHWETMVWIDSHQVGRRDSLGVPHRYHLTDHCRAGKTHTITIRVNNEYIIPVGKDAHSISDQTQSNWNGIIGSITLTAEPTLWLEDVQVYPNVERKRIRVIGHMKTLEGQAGQGTLALMAESKNNMPTHKPDAKTIDVRWDDRGGVFELIYEMGEDCLFWDENQPALYTLNLKLESGEKLMEQALTFGMREIGIQNKQFTMNGRKIFLRGTLECCIFPKHGYPPTDVAEWKRIIRIAKSYGLNHFRFHSWCPPKAAFIAADEIGFYLQAEASCWARFGDGTDVDTWIYQECDRMLKEYGNHPSFILMAPSNEPHGENREAFLGDLINYLRNKDTRRFYTAGAGWPRIPENQFHIQSTTRLQRWPTLKFDRPPQTWDDYRSFVEALEVPTISHEIGQWCVYPDLREDRYYNGVLKAENIAIFRDKLQQAGMGRLGQDFLMASGKFQTLLYKQEIEAALRTPHFAGFQLLDLHDFPGQGTAPVGVLNALWQDKGYVDGEKYRQFCNDIVPLLRMKKRTFSTNEIYNARIEVANYSTRDLHDVRITCRARDESGKTLFRAPFYSSRIPNGGLTRIGEIEIPLASINQPSRINIEVEFVNQPYLNQWDIWVYPEPKEDRHGKSVHIRQNWRQALNLLQAGENVLLAPKPFLVAGNTLGTFRPIFWNRITFPQQAVHTLGILCDRTHPALANFPTQRHCNWQWQELLDASKPIVMDELPDTVNPIVQPIDDWNNCRKLGVLFEAKVGLGKVMVCSMDITNNLDKRIVARQLRHSLLHYMNSDQFQPRAELSSHQFKSVFKEPTLLQKYGAKVKSDSAQSGHEAENAIDGNPQSIWHTEYKPNLDPCPHYIIVELMESLPLQGITYLPRQDMENGRIAKYEVYVSPDGKSWTGPLAKGTWKNDKNKKTVRFPRKYKARFIKLKAIEEVNKNAYASAAEIGLLLK